MEHSTTVRAESVDKAVKIALTKLGLSQDQVTINVINEGKRGLFGFGKQDAIVQVTAKETPKLSDLLQENQIETNPQPESKAQVSETLAVEEDETHPDVVDVELIESHDDQGQVVQEPQEEPAENDPESLEVVEAGDQESDQDQASAYQEEHLKVAAYLEDVIREYGADATITVESNRNQVVFNIETEKSGLIIGKHGKIINALQVLAQIMVHQYDKRRQSVILNIGDYRDRRASVLEQIAERTAKEVLRTKQAVVLDPLPSYERKQIHAYLSKIDHVETHSEGKDPNRYLVVEYKA